MLFLLAISHCNSVLVFLLSEDVWYLKCVVRLDSEPPPLINGTRLWRPLRFCSKLSIIHCLQRLYDDQRAAGLGAVVSDSTPSHLSIVYMRLSNLNRTGFSAFCERFSTICATVPVTYVICIDVHQDGVAFEANRIFNRIMP